MRSVIYTVGYTLFQKAPIMNDSIVGLPKSSTDIDGLFSTLRQLKVDYLVDVRFKPYSGQYPECNFDNMKAAGKKLGVTYMHMPELGAKADSQSDVYSKASDIFFEDWVFPIEKSNRPKAEGTPLNPAEEIVDFSKFRYSEFFVSGLERIKHAYEQNFTLCLMCSEKDPMDCHRYFLIGKALEQRFGDWLEVRHIVANDAGADANADTYTSYATVSNSDLDKQLEAFVIKKDKMGELLFPSLLGDDPLSKYAGNNRQEQLADFCDRYWNLLHGWKRN